MKFPNYNILANKPITNLVGTATDPIDLDSLVDVGTYNISWDVTSADWSLVTEVDAIIASWDVFLSVLDFGTPAQVYSLLAPSQYVFRVYSWGWGAITIINYIQDDWAWNVTVGWSVTAWSDNAYWAGWNGSLRLATENAIYDKIETMGGAWAKEFRITIPGEVVQDSSNAQWLYFLNSSGSSRTISNVAVKVATAAGTTCSVNVYKSSGTDADWLNTSAVNLFTSAIALGTGYSSLTNAPNTATVENGRWLNVRVTSSTGTPKASDLQIVITYT